MVVKPELKSATLFWTVLIRMRALIFLISFAVSPVDSLYAPRI